MSNITEITVNGTTYTMKDKNSVQFNEVQELTDEQKARARENIGANKTEGKYELIETITMEEAARLERSQEPDGTPYNFEALFFHINVPADVTVTNGSFYFFTNPNTSKYICHRWTAEKTGAAANIIYHGRIYKQNGIWCWYLPSDFAKDGSSPLIYDAVRSDLNRITSGDSIQKLSFSQTFPIGTIINIYGVRV